MLKELLPPTTLWLPGAGGLGPGLTREPVCGGAGVEEAVWLQALFNLDE